MGTDTRKSHGNAWPGPSPFPPFAPARIEAARERYGHTVDRYLQYLQLGDPLADDLLECFSRITFRQGFRLLAQAIDHGIESIDDPPPALVALFQQLDYIPFWVDWQRMNRASAKILRNGWLPALSLAVYVLPHSYLATGNKPLVFTGALLHSTAERYALSARFITEVFLPGNLRRDAEGFKMAVLVRIMHARARRQILRSGKWDPSTFELPLNHAHMAMGILFFSYFVIQGMRRLGGWITPEDQDNILLTWRYVAYLFGIDPEIVPTSEAEVRHLIDVAFSLECDPDDKARELCRALIESAPEFTDITNPVQGRLFVKLLYALSRHLLGNELADLLGYPKARYWWLCRTWIAMSWVWERFPVLVPSRLRCAAGIQFWLEHGSYDMTRYGNLG